MFKKEEKKQGMDALEFLAFVFVMALIFGVMIQLSGQ